MTATRDGAAGATAPPATAFAGLSTATLSDALDRLHLPGSARGISPLADGQRMAGPAATVRYVPLGADGGTVGDYIDDLPAGTVVVLDNYGRTDCTVWGDILTAVAHAKGIAGTAIHGVNRDVERALALGYPIYSSGRFMRTGKDRVAAVDMDCPVALGDVQVRPGDIVVGDDDGVVVVPASRAQEVLEIGQEIAERESQILESFGETGSLRAARQAHGYHLLQRGADRG